MKEICIPISELDEKQIAEVEIKIGDEKRKVHYRLESFPWDGQGERTEEERKSAERIQELIRLINSYDKHWELIQLYNPGPGQKHVRVLFREKTVEVETEKGEESVS